MNKNTNDGQRRKPHRTAVFLHNKIFILFFLPVLALIIIIAVVLILRVINPPAAETPVAAVGDYIYVLPIKERSADNIPTVGKDPFISEGATGLRLDGIVYNPDGTSIAVISSVNASYVVSNDDSVGQTGWVVAIITADTVTITKNEKTEMLSLIAKTVDGINRNDTGA